MNAEGGIEMRMSLLFLLLSALPRSLRGMRLERDSWPSLGLPAAPAGAE